MYCYYDGMIMKESDVSISPMNHGFLYGVGFFETFRTYNGEVFQLDAHFERLTRALTDLNMACSL
ncbi:MAG TPA: aminotransferase class IV, partial [Savagea sp.]